MLHHKSAANMSNSTTSEDRPLLPGKRASTARSENCLLLSVAEDLDYDDLPPEDEVRAPVVPAKHKPKLPPKQKIDKSQDDLARIESSFKSSLGELRMGEEDYDDLPEPEENRAKKRPKSASIVASASREYEDYDDPISHGKTKASRDREYEDYDEPIHHSRG